MNSLYIGPSMTVFIVSHNAPQTATSGSIHRPVLAADDNPFRATGTGYGFAYQMAGVNEYVVSLGNDTIEEKLQAENVLQDGTFNIFVVRRNGATSSELFMRRAWDSQDKRRYL